MPQVEIRNTVGSVVSSVELHDVIFSVARNDTLIHQAVLRILANRRSGTASTKTRGMVKGTTAKWYRQKGTGRARHGAQTAPNFRKGGVVFGPHPRSYRQDMPQKMRRKALCSVLTDKLAEGRIHVVEGFSFTQPRTREMVAVLKALGVEKRILIVLPGSDPLVMRSARNIPQVRTTVAHTLNVLDAIDSDHIIFTQAGLQAFQSLLAGQDAAGVTPQATEAGASRTQVIDSAPPLSFTTASFVPEGRVSGTEEPESRPLSETEE